jgi:hypothetical protein
MVGRGVDLFELEQELGVEHMIHNTGELCARTLGAMHVRQLGDGQLLLARRGVSELGFQFYVGDILGLHFAAHTHNFRIGPAKIKC